MAKTTDKINNPNTNQSSTLLSFDIIKSVLPIIIKTAKKHSKLNNPNFDVFLFFSLSIKSFIHHLLND